MNQDWYGFELIRPGRPPSGDPMDVYLLKMQRLKRESQGFSKEGFTFGLGEKLISLAQLNGWELYHLFCFAKRIPDGGTYLEIGSWVGGSLMCVYEASKLSGAGINLIAIERSVRRQLVHNTKSIPRLKIIGCASDMAKNKVEDSSVDLLFLDSSHEYEPTKKELENYWSKIKSGGVLLGHDYRIKSAGVIQAVNERFIGRGGFTVLPNSTLFMVRKRK